tara:strand:- start:671 stop:1606 length:936 start_codon:yes stop_codon:yes gene_type:complete
MMKGALAQLGERLPCTQEVGSSILPGSTKILFIILKVINNIKEMFYERALISKKVALVATMGSLHKGHEALMKRSKEISDVTIASLFINPKQFDSYKDFDRYPTSIDSDLNIFEQNKVEIVFMPDKNEMYNQEFNSVIKINDLNNELEGNYRKGHMDGVSTVVMKLFNIIKPNIALFGEKDFQQLKLIEKMVSDFSMDIKIEPVETVRDSNGLALSSRNHLLNKRQRISAQSIRKSLELAIVAFKKGQVVTNEVCKIVIDYLDKVEEIKLEYVTIRTLDTFKEIKYIKGPFVLLIAAYVGDIRLIDNYVFR